ncbi:hypothetical protein U9M48_006804 [Paspalum notatum var. saurae]|uniref:Uncharacterized protein n=1 Tax=Paspalum notatum var. saurae TaxID=547442 RepID=A0AAQ3Q0L8_PASNO
MDCLELYNSLHPMNQLKPTVSLASLLDDVVDVMVLRITSARHATVALRFHAMAHVKHFPVDMTSRRCYVKCAILCHVCCIHIQENLLMVIAKTSAMSTTEHCFIYLCLAVDRKLTS